MPEATQPIQLTDDDYRAMEAAFDGDALMRAFLRRRDRRSRAGAIDRIRRLTRGLRGRLVMAEGVVAHAAAVRRLRRELHEMGAAIRQTRDEVAMLGAPGGARPRLVSAAGELDAIASTTERATCDILAGVERIDALARALPPSDTASGSAIIAETTAILTVCAFHDVTGQRLAKVVTTLRYLEARANAMIAIWGAIAPDPARPRDGEPTLLNGPSADGVTQADIDALFAEAS